MPTPLSLIDLRALYDQEMRINIQIPGTIKETFPGLVRFTRPVSGMNFVQYSRLPADQLDAVIQQQIDYYRPIGQPFEWVTMEYDQPAGLLDALARHGFQPEDPHPILLLDLAHPPAALLEPVTADIRRVEHLGDLETVIGILGKVWDADFSWMRKRIGEHLLIPGYLSMYIAYVEDQPASTAWIYFHPGSRFAGLFGGSTLPEYRGAGLYTQLLATRAQEAARRGYDYLVIDASDMSRPIVEKHGFFLLATTIACEYQEPAP